MEIAAVACQLARARPGSRARRRAWEHGVAVGPAPSAARRRLLVASLGVGESLPAQTLVEEAVVLEVGVVEPLPPQSLGEEAVALEVIRCRLAVGRWLVTRSFDREFAITDSHNYMKSIDFGAGG